MGYPAPAYDNNGNPFQVGAIVNVPCVVAAITTSSQNGIQLLTLTAQYNSPNNTPLSITTVYANQTQVKQ